jgi:hypothetical protein
MGVWRNRIILLAAFVLLGGAAGDASCGPDVGIASTVTPDGATSSLRWIGVDPRPLAVGTTASLTFELAPGVPSLSGYQLQSSDPSVLTVTDLGNQTVSLTAQAAGSAEVQLISDNALLGSLSLTVEQPTSIVFADPSNLAAGIPNDTDLQPSPATFGLLVGGQEAIQAVISGADGDSLLASQEVVTGSGYGVSVTPGGGASFILGALFDPTATFTGGLQATPSSALTFNIEIVAAATNAILKSRVDGTDGSIYVLAVAQDASGNEIFGLPNWTFTLSGPGTAVRLGSAAVKLIFPTATAAQSVTLTATNGTLDAGIQLP